MRTLATNVTGSLELNGRTSANTDFSSLAHGPNGQRALAYVAGYEEVWVVTAAP